MPITKSAKKALRQSKRKKKFNISQKRAMGDILRKIKKLKVEGKKAEAQKLISSAYKIFDKAAKRGVIKKNAAARKKSRITKFLKK